MDHRATTGLLLGIALLVGGPARADEAEQAGRIVAEDVNVRAGPARSYQIVCQADRDDRVVVRGTIGDWSRVHLPGNDASAYVYGRYVEMTGPRRGRITGSRVNVRLDPGRRGAILGQLDEDASLRVQGREGDWVQVRFPRAFDLFVRSDFLEVVDEPLPGASRTLPDDGIPGEPTEADGREDDGTSSSADDDDATSEPGTSDEARAFEGPPSEEHRQLIEHAFAAFREAAAEPLESMDFGEARRLAGLARGDDVHPRIRALAADLITRIEAAERVREAYRDRLADMEELEPAGEPMGDH